MRALAGLYSLLPSTRKAGGYYVLSAVGRADSQYVPGAVLIVTSLPRSVSLHAAKALPLGELSRQGRD